MSEELIFTTDDRVVSNLSRLAKEHSLVSEQRLLELCDVAFSMAEATGSLLFDGLDAYEILSFFEDSIALGDYSVSDETTYEHRAAILRGTENLKRVDRAILVGLYLDAIKERGYPVSEYDFLPGAEADETFTYVRNSFSDEAYDVFSQDFSDPKVRYSSSFKECAQAVVDGDVSYCLLPLEERGGSRLHTVSEIIFRNDFKINSVIPVFGPDGSADMKYALLSKNFVVPNRAPDDDLYLEIRLGADDSLALSETLAAIDYLGMRVYRANTVTFDTEGESETYFSVVIKDSGEGFSPILTYLMLFVRDFVPVGIYKNLE